MVPKPVAGLRRPFIRSSTDSGNCLSDMKSRPGIGIIGPTDCQYYHSWKFVAVREYILHFFRIVLGFHSIICFENHNSMTLPHGGSP